MPQLSLTELRSDYPQALVTPFSDQALDRCTQKFGRDTHVWSRRVPTPRIVRERRQRKIESKGARRPGALEVLGNRQRYWIPVERR